MSKWKPHYLENIDIVYAIRHKDDVKGSIARNRKTGDSSRNEKFGKKYQISWVNFSSNKWIKEKGTYVHFSLGRKTTMNYDFWVISICQWIFVCLYLLYFFMEMIEHSFNFVCFQEQCKLVTFCLNPKVFSLNFVVLFVSQRHLRFQEKSISQEICRRAQCISYANVFV